MTTATRPDVAQLEATSERAEQARVEAAEAERAAYQQWQDAYGAYEVACDDAKAAWRAWVEATVP
jgi:hypothetical protein